MKRYEFYRNQKITVIDCRYFSFEAENLETAVQKIKDLCCVQTVNSTNCQTIRPIRKMLLIKFPERNIHWI